MVSELRVQGVIEESVVDGPGLRFALFTQGCPHHCPGCHNPETHDAGGGYTVFTETLLDQFRQNPLLAGITFSGGEPFEQAAPLADLAADIHACGKTVIVYTGYTLEALHAMAEKNTAVDLLLEQADILVDGPYVQALHDPDLPHRGSSNQRMLNRREILSLRNNL